MSLSVSLDYIIFFSFKSMNKFSILLLQSWFIRWIIMSSLVVQVKEGKIKGSLVENVEGGEYIAFRGIPYAEPPVGELRFKVKFLSQELSIPNYFYTHPFLYLFYKLFHIIFSLTVSYTVHNYMLTLFTEYKKWDVNYFHNAIKN